jgi:hypothetical protein
MVRGYGTLPYFMERTRVAEIRITFVRNRIRQHSTLMRIRILLSNKEMRICDHWSTEPPGLNPEPSRLQCERPRPSTAPF